MEKEKEDANQARLEKQKDAIEQVAALEEEPVRRLTSNDRPLTKVV